MEGIKSRQWEGKKEKMRMVALLRKQANKRPFASCHSYPKHKAVVTARVRKI